MTLLLLLIILESETLERTNTTEPTEGNCERERERMSKITNNFECFLIAIIASETAINVVVVARHRPRSSPSPNENHPKKNCETNERLTKKRAECSGKPL